LYAKRTGARFGLTARVAFFANEGVPSYND